MKTTILLVAMLLAMLCTKCQSKWFDSLVQVNGVVVVAYGGDDNEVACEKCRTIHGRRSMIIRPIEDRYKDASELTGIPIDSLKKRVPGFYRFYAVDGANCYQFTYTNTIGHIISSVFEMDEGKIRHVEVIDVTHWENQIELKNKTGYQ